MNLEIILSSITVSYLSLFVFQKVFLKKGITDKINSRSSHSSIATRNGGIAIFLSVFIISSISY